MVLKLLIGAGVGVVIDVALFALWVRFGDVDSLVAW